VLLFVAGSLPDGFLLFTDSYQKMIYRMDLKSQSYVNVPLSGHDKPIAIAYDYVDGRIYWTDVGTKQIRSGSINGNAEKTVLILDTGTRFFIHHKHLEYPENN
jgi:streptogramin lyase